MRRISVSILMIGMLLGAFAHADEARRDYLAAQREYLRVSPLAQGSDRAPLSLSECITLALHRNAKLLAHDEAMHAAQAQRSEANARGWPILDYEYLTGPAPGDVSDVMGSFTSGNVAWAHRGKLGLGIPLYSFGKLSVLQQLAEQGLRKAEWDQRKETATLISQVRQLYYALQLGEDVAGVLIEAIDGLTEQLSNAGLEDDAASDEQSPATMSPIKRLELQLLRAELEKRLSETRQKQRVGVHALRVQLGMPADTVVQLGTRSLRAVETRLDPLDMYVERAYAQRSDAQLLDVGIEAKRLEYRLEKKKQLPDIGVGGFVELGRTVGRVDGVTSTDDYNDPFNFTRGGLGVQLKGRFDPHGAAARTRKKRHEYYQVRMQRDIAREGIALQVREAYEEALRTQIDIVRSEENAALARRMLFLAKSNQELGVGENDEYVEALKQVLLTRGQVYEATFQYNSARAKLDEQTGMSQWTP